MVKSKFKKVGYSVLLILVLFIPTKGWSGGSFPTLPVPNSLNASHDLFFFWDTRNRDSFFQIYNISPTDPARVHIQIFDVANDCQESNFFDALTPRDTHVYNLRNVIRNSVPGPVFSFDNGYGLIAVTLSNEFGNVLIDPILIGNFRIVDESGYEYRGNAAGFFQLSSPILAPTTDSYSFNFNDVDGTNFSDVVGMPILLGYDLNTATGPATVAAGGPIGIVFNANLWDENENLHTCQPVAFGCNFHDSIFQERVDEYEANFGINVTPGFNLGINNAIPNSRGEEEMCIGVLSKGIATLTTSVIFEPEANFFVGFVGLNNGDGTGSMNPFVASPP